MDVPFDVFWCVVVSSKKEAPMNSLIDPSGPSVFGFWMGGRKTHLGGSNIVLSSYES